MRKRNHRETKCLLLNASIVMIALCLFLVSGCIIESKTTRVDIEKGVDDGAIYILRELYPATIAGYTNGGLEGAFVGTVTSGGGDPTISRALYRFNVSSWNGKDITFHCYCSLKQGNPDKIEVYVIDDFGPLPEEQKGDPHDVSSVWNLADAGTKVGEVNVDQGKWFKITIPSNVVKPGGYLALMLKLSNEDAEGDNAYAVSTSESIQKPYITWEK